MDSTDSQAVPPATVEQAEALVAQAVQAGSDATEIARDALRRDGRDPDHPSPESELKTAWGKHRWAKDGDGKIPPGITLARGALSFVPAAERHAQMLLAALRRENGPDTGPGREEALADTWRSFAEHLKNATTNVAVYRRMFGGAGVEPDPLLEAFCAIGGNLWYTDQHLRVYFDAPVWTGAAGLDAGSRYHTEKITRPISKVYYDADDGKIHAEGRDGEVYTLEQLIAEVSEGLRSAAARARSGQP